MVDVDESERLCNGCEARAKKQALAQEPRAAVGGKRVAPPAVVAPPTRASLRSLSPAATEPYYGSLAHAGPSGPRPPGAAAWDRVS